MKGAATIHRFIAIDWSAKSGLSPAKPSKDALWASKSVLHEEEPQSTYFRSRAECVQYVKEEIQDAKKSGERVLIGFDFAFGYPSGYAKALGIKGGWRNFISHLSELIRDEENVNNRFEVADQLNARLGKQGPLWGHPATHSYSNLGPKKGVFPHRARAIDIAEFRTVDLSLRHKGIQPIWKICYTASVGGQTLMGLPYLHFLSADKDIGQHVAIWPFDTHFVDDPFTSHSETVATVVEIWPGIMPIDARHKSSVRDEGQVKTISAFMKKTCLAGRLPDYFNPLGISTAPNLDELMNEEGWIFGAPYAPP